MRGIQTVRDRVEKEPGGGEGVTWSSKLGRWDLSEQKTAQGMTGR